MQEEGLPWPSSGGKLQASSARGTAGSITGPGTKILHPPRRSQKQEKKKKWKKQSRNLQVRILEGLFSKHGNS